MYPTQERPVNGTFVRTQVESLRARGLKVEVLLVRPRTAGPRLLNGALKYVAAWRDLRHRVRVGDVDVVHAHFVFPALLAVCQRRAPVVITFHGDDVLGTVAREAEGTLTWTSRRIVVPLSRVLAKHAVPVVQSAQMKDRLACPEAVVVPCEVDLDRFQPIAVGSARELLALDPGRPYVLFASDPSIPVKNHALAVEATQRARSELPDLQLLVVHREPQEHLALYMSACNALLVTSHQEGSPNIVKQAMACNLPVISTDVGDVREMLAGARPSEVCRADATELSSALVHVVTSGARSDGRQWISWLDGGWVVDRLLACYDSARARR